MLVSVDLTAPTSSSESSLVKSIGTFGLAAGIVNVTIGGGIFRLPADMAATLGPTAPVAYLLCALAMGLIVLCIAEAGSRVSLTGGPYAYVGVAFGPFAGFLAGFLLWIVLTFVMAAVATVLMASLGALVPAVSSRGASTAVLVIIYGIFAAINILGVVAGIRRKHPADDRQDSPAVAFDCGRTLRHRLRQFRHHRAAPLATVARSSILLIFAFAGIEAALVPGGEMKNPARTVPAAILIAMVTITILYAALQFVAQGVLGPALATSKQSPLADAAGIAMGGWARNVLLVGAVVSMLGHAGAAILVAPRSLFAFARDGFLPAALARLHPVHRSPVAAIVLQCTIVLVLATTSTFERLAVLANLATLVVYAMCCIATWQLRRRDVQGWRHTVQGSRTNACHRTRLPGDRLDADQRHAGGVGCVRDRAGSRGGDLRAAPSNLSQSQPQDHHAHLAGAGSATGTARTMKRWGAEPTW